MKLPIGLLLAGMCLALSSARAMAGRPLVVDDAPPVPQGHVELEMGINQTYFPGGGRERRLPVIAFGLGLGNGVETGFAIQRIDSNPKGQPRRRGFEDIHLNAKYQFLEERGHRPEAALALDLKLPTASRRKGLTSGRADGSFAWIATKTFSPVALDLNLGYQFVGSPKGEKLKNRVHGGLALRRTVHRDWQLVGEISGLSRETPRDPHDARFQVGTRYQATSTIVVDAAVGRGLLSNGPWIQATFGFTWLLPVSL